MSSISELVDISEQAPMRFGQRNRRGNWFGFTALQATLLLVVVLVDVGAMVVADFRAWPLWLATAPFLVLAVARLNGEAVLTTAHTWFGFARRKAGGQAQFLRDVTEPEFEALTFPPSMEGLRAVSQHATTRLPGDLGDTPIYQIAGSGAFTFDQRRNRAAITLGLRSKAWELADPDAQQVAIDGFAKWLSSLEHERGLEAVVLRVSADRSASTELADYLDRKGVEVTEALDKEYAVLIDEGAGRAFEFSSTVTVTFNTSALSRELAELGGGLPALSHVLQARVTSLSDGLEQTKVLVESWLTATELEAMISKAWDPVAAARHRAAGHTIAPPVMAVREGWQHIRSDESWHSVTWVSEWPRKEATAGFMLPLLMRGASSRTVVLEVSAVPTAKALREVNRQLSDMVSSARLREKLGFRSTRDSARGISDVEDREKDLVHGFGALDFRGFVVSSAPSEDELRAARNDIEQAAHRSMLKVAPMTGQQAASFVTAMLPVPVVRNK